MLTRFKREDLPKAVHGEDANYPSSQLVADKLKTIYVAHGWAHMLRDYHQANELVDELTLGVMRELITKDESNLESAGLMVRGFVDRDGDVYLDYFYSLG